jgi:hypothetical protein
MTQAVFGGRLTPTPGVPVLTADAIASSTLGYSPVDGDSILINGTLVTFLSGPTDQVGWILNIAGLAVGQYHVFASPTGLCTLPFSTVLTRNCGILVDPATNNPWLGGISISVAGQVTCHLSEDYNRKFEVYNGYNQKLIAARMVSQERDLGYCPTNEYIVDNAPNFHYFHNNPLDCINIFTGAPEVVDVTYSQDKFVDSLTGAYGLISAIGWNSLTPVGSWSGGTQDATGFAGAVDRIARYVNPAAVGANIAYMLIAAAVNSGNEQSQVDSASSGASGVPLDADNLMIAKWFG